MPISPTPPSGANTRSCGGRPCVRLQSPNTSPAVTAVVPPGCAISSRPASSRPSKRPRSSRSGRRTRIGWPSPAARLSQAARIDGEALPRSPIRPAAPAWRTPTAREHLRGRHRGAGFGKIGRGKRRIGRMADAIDADADGGGEHRLVLALDQDAGELSPRRAANHSAISPSARAERAARIAATASCSASAATKDNCGAADGGDGSVKSSVA